MDPQTDTQSCLTTTSAVSSTLPHHQLDSRSDLTTAPSVHTDLSSTNEYKNRYQHPNVALEMDQWFSMVDRYGFFDQGIPSQDDQRKKAKEVERAEKWASMAKPLMDNGFHDFDYTSKFINRVYKGIPDCWRRDAWYFMCTNRWKDASQDKELHRQYESYKTLETPSEKQIDLDIPRTMHNHIMFRQRYGSGQCTLFDVLCAFSNYDTQVGYCQGMASIVAILLMYFEDDKAFMILVHMFQRDNLHDLFITGFPALMRAFAIQDNLMKRYAPKLAKHLRHLDISTDMYATRWYITLFTGNVVSYPTLLRIWDVYFMHGFDVFYAVALALLLTSKKRLLASDMEEALMILNGTIDVQDDQFIALVKKMFERSQRHLPHLKKDTNSLQVPT